ncbi:MAG: hypothetical protein K6C14_02855 [Eubacterium sp.]|nr:hypothetical protein [Eubacterium sp.]
MKNFNDVISGVDDVISSAKNGGFEEVLAKTRDYAAKATKRSAERLEVSRKKIELLDSKTKLAKAYEKFGRIEYARREGEEISEDEYKSCLAQIELQKIRTEMLDKEIEELRRFFSESAPPQEDDEPADVEVETVEPDDE